MRFNLGFIWLPVRLLELESYNETYNQGTYNFVDLSAPRFTVASHGEPHLNL
jgi:hypothetical protein